MTTLDNTYEIDTQQLTKDTALKESAINRNLSMCIPTWDSLGLWNSLKINKKTIEN